MEEADHGQGYEGDSSSGSGRSWGGGRSRRQRAGRRSQVGTHGRRSPGADSEANGLALVSGFKRLPRQDVITRPVTSVLVRRKEEEGEGGAPLETWGRGRTRGQGGPRGTWSSPPPLPSPTALNCWHCNPGRGGACDVMGCWEGRCGPCLSVHPIPPLRVRGPARQSDLHQAYHRIGPGRTQPRAPGGRPRLAGEPCVWGQWARRPGLTAMLVGPTGAGNPMALPPAPTHIPSCQRLHPVPPGE